MNWTAYYSVSVKTVRIWNIGKPHVFCPNLNDTARDQFKLGGEYIQYVRSADRV